MQVYMFKDENWNGSPPDVCIGPRPDVTALVDLDELKAVYGGYALYVIDDDASEYVGVWGTRKASRFRQLLRARGATLDLVERQPTNMRLKVKTVVYSN